MMIAHDMDALEYLRTHTHNKGGSAKERDMVCRRALKYRLGA